MIHHGDCLNVMAGMEPESIDAICTDPPYGIGFMGREWDDAKRLASVPPSAIALAATGRDPYPKTDKGPAAVAFDGRAFQEWSQRWAEAAYRVAKPSAYLLAFGGTRTVHRMTVALEDAGWIIRDMLVWAYASGFPKSKASLKPAWEPIVMARKPGPLRMLAIDECRIPTDEIGGPRGDTTGRTGDNGIYRQFAETGGSTGNGATSPLGRWPANLVLTDPIFDGGVGGVVGGGEAGGGFGVRGRNALGVINDDGWEPSDEGGIVGYGDSGTYSRFYALPVRIGTCWYCGAPIADASSKDGETTATPSDTAPASASSLLSSSPSDPVQSAATPSGGAGGNTAHQPVLMWADEASESVQDSPTTNGTETASSPVVTGTTPPTPRNKPRGTSPANGPRKVSAKSLGVASEATDTTTTIPARPTCATCADLITSGSIVPADLPDRTRFLIIPKADRADREPVLGGLPERNPFERDGPSANFERMGSLSKPRMNAHPTVKPTELMRHLVRLVTPAGGTVLDPFLGSGTTGLACELEGFPWIGIEKEAEYVAIAEARLNGTQRGLGLDVPAPTRKPPKTHPDLSKHIPKQRAASENYSGRWAGTDSEDVA